MAGLMLTFRANPAHRMTASGEDEPRGLPGRESREKLGETRAAILQAMRDNPKISARKLSGILSISVTAVENNLRYLKTRGYLKRIGPAKGGNCGGNRDAARQP